MTIESVSIWFTVHRCTHTHKEMILEHSIDLVRSRLEWDSKKAKGAIQSENTFALKSIKILPKESEKKITNECPTKIRIMCLVSSYSFTCFRYNILIKRRIESESKSKKKSKHSNASYHSDAKLWFLEGVWESESSKKGEKQRPWQENIMQHVTNVLQTTAFIARKVWNTHTHTYIDKHPPFWTQSK